MTQSKSSQLRDHSNIENFQILLDTAQAFADGISCRSRKDSRSIPPLFIESCQRVFLLSCRIRSPHESLLIQVISYDCRQNSTRRASPSTVQLSPEDRMIRRNLAQALFRKMKVITKPFACIDLFNRQAWETICQWQEEIPSK